MPATGPSCAPASARARETGDYDDVVRAEEAARSSLALRTVHNASTYLLLSASLLEQHRFREANEAARLLFESDPENPAYRAHWGETQLELGDYDAARVTFGSLEPARNSLDVAPRLARWEEIVGRTGQARLLLEAARDQAVKRSDLSREQVAWFHLRVGDLELRNGRLKQAEKAFRTGLEVNLGTTACWRPWHGSKRHAKDGNRRSSTATRQSPRCSIPAR